MSQTARPRRTGAANRASLSQPDLRLVSPSRHREARSPNQRSDAARDRQPDSLDDVVSTFYTSVAAGARWITALQRAFDSLKAAMGLNSIALSLPSQPDGGADEMGSDGPRRRGRSRSGRYGEGVETSEVSLTFQSRRLGAIVAQRSSAHPFTRAERAVLERLAMGLSLALHASSLQEQAVWLARCRERQAIADKLHDDVAPVLFSMRCALESLLDAPDANRAGELLTYAHELVVRGEIAVRDVVEPGSDDGAENIVFELAELLRALEDRFRVPIAFDVDSSAEAKDVQLRAGPSRALLRAAKEGVSNAVTHAEPELITISLEATRGWLNLKVADDGCGRRASTAGGHGLSSVRKELWRLGGELQLVVGDTRGATLSVRLPVVDRS